MFSLAFQRLKLQVSSDVSALSNNKSRAFFYKDEILLNKIGSIYIRNMKLY